MRSGAQRPQPHATHRSRRPRTKCESRPMPHCNTRWRRARSGRWRRAGGGGGRRATGPRLGAPTRRNTPHVGEPRATSKAGAGGGGTAQRGTHRAPGGQRSGYHAGAACGKARWPASRPAVVITGCKSNYGGGVAGTGGQWSADAPPGARATPGSCPACLPRAATRRGGRDAPCPPPRSLAPPRDRSCLVVGCCGGCESGAWERVSRFVEAHWRRPETAGTCHRTGGVGVAWQHEDRRQCLYPGVNGSARSVAAVATPTAGRCPLPRRRSQRVR